MCRIVILLVFLFFPSQLLSQILPKEGATLNYRLVGFQVPSAIKSTGYAIEIAKGNFNNVDSFVKNIVQKVNCKGRRNIVEVPAFGKQYTWRISPDSKINNEVTSSSSFHHFSTGLLPEVDTHQVRLRVTQKAKKYQDALVFIDGNRALYDMKGNPLWYLPIIEGSATTPHDLKLSNGSITCLVDEQIYDLDYNGSIIWKGPNTGDVSGDSIEHYNHDIIKLENGHYLTIGTENVLWNSKYPSENDSALIIPNGTKNERSMITSHFLGKDYHKLPLATLIEYDKDGKVVWSWRYSRYFKESDIYKYKKLNGMPDLMTLHNSLAINEKDGLIYLGFKAINRIIKIKYPEGNITGTFGEQYMPNGKVKTESMFCGQHNIRINSAGQLYLFNNNCCYTDRVPEILIFKEPASLKDTLQKVWEYKCAIDGDTKIHLDSNKRPVYNFLRGGTVLELPDKSIFAVMSGNYSKVFIITRDKKIVWGAVPEKWNQEKMIWEPIFQYRTNIIYNRKEFERLVWCAESAI